MKRGFLEEEKFPRQKKIVTKIPVTKFLKMMELKAAKILCTKLYSGINSMRKKFLTAKLNAMKSSSCKIFAAKFLAVKKPLIFVQIYQEH